VLAFPDHGFVLLLLPKTASTTLERTLTPHASKVLRTAPGVKHVQAAGFERKMVPRLAAMGHPRDSYEVVTMFREPVEWLESWWRYRARVALDRRKPQRSTAGISFDDFARSYVACDRRLPTPKGRPGRFITVDGAVAVDRVFAVDRPDCWQGWFSDRLGRDLGFERLNVSNTATRGELSPATRTALREYFAPEYEIWDRLTATGQASGVRGLPLVVPPRPRLVDPA